MPSPEDTLLRACALLFQFRALARSQEEAQRILWEEQIIRLIGDLVPCSGGAVVLGAGNEDVPADCVAVPLYIRDEIAGLLAIWFGPEETDRLAGHRETLSAIATLASSALENVRDVERLRTENALLRNRLDTVDTGMVGESPAIGNLQRMIGRVAPRDTSVLVMGESGTGKELVAQALHRLSARVEKPFVAINCAALTDTLLESELFGHERGAFTGAVAQKKGKLEMAEGGTVFLDEIGELAPLLQAKLLRVLQQREFERVGGTRTMKLNVRVVAATNRDLAAEVRRGAFREDLYHRLNVVALRVPPLRERPGDVMPLARHFLETLRRAVPPPCDRHLAGSRTIPGCLCLARQCARTGKCHRARRGVGAVRNGAAGGSAGNDPGCRNRGGRARRFADLRDPDQARADSGRVSRMRRRSQPGRGAPEDPPQLSPPPAPHAEFERESVGPTPRDMSLEPMCPCPERNRPGVAGGEMAE